MKNIPITAIGMRKYGLTVVATIIAPVMLSIACDESSIAFGKNSSTALKADLIQ